MDYKQKYEEALEKAKNELEVCGSEDCDAARQIFRLFPELEENKDEKARKYLIKCVEEWESGHCLWNSDKKTCQKLLAWLEKQGELVNLSQLERVAKPRSKKNFIWSEEDGRMLIEVLATVHDKINYVGTDKKAISSITEQISWLKSLKERMKGETI